MRLLSVYPATNIPDRVLGDEEPRRQRSLHGSRSCRLAGKDQQGQEWRLYDPMISPPSPGPLSVCDTGPLLDTCNIYPFPSCISRCGHSSTCHRIALFIPFYLFFSTSLMPAFLADTGCSSRVGGNPARASSRRKKRTRDGLSAILYHVVGKFLFLALDAIVSA